MWIEAREVKSNNSEYNIYLFETVQFRYLDLRPVTYEKFFWKVISASDLRKRFNKSLLESTFPVEKVTFASYGIRESKFHFPKQLAEMKSYFRKLLFHLKS